MAGKKLLLIPLSIAMLTGVLSYCWQATGWSDVYFRLCAARAWVAGEPPYSACPQTFRGTPMAEYPFTTLIALVPLTYFPDRIAASVFWGVSNAILALGIVRNGKRRHWLIFLSGAYWIAALWQQYSVLIAGVMLLPDLLPLALIKPQVGIPVMLTNMNWRRLLGGCVFIALSLVLYPTWPLAWWQRSNHYDGVIPLLVFPLGTLVALVLLNWRERAAWVLFLFACMPQRIIYDLVPLFLLPRTVLQMGILCALSWIPAIAVFIGDGGFPEIQVTYTLAFVYFPLLIMILVPLVEKFRGGKRMAGN
jgi:hypothetical protein